MGVDWLFTAEIETVSLIELIWLFPGCFGLAILTGALYRDGQRWWKVRHLPYSYRRQAELEAAVNFIIRHVILWLVLLPCVYVGVVAMMRPPTAELTYEGKIATLILIAIEAGLVTSALHDEWTYRRIRGWLDMVPAVRP